VQHKLATKQLLDSKRQPAFGIQKYIWRASDESCEFCGPMDGQILTWGEGPSPGGVHPNCQCSAEPIPEDADKPYDPPIDRVYPLETLLAGLATGIGRAIAREIIKRVGGGANESTEHSETAEKIAEGHAYDKHKNEFPEIRNREEL
jgi:hypothetical protein